jgi:hypothetical protein
MPIRIARMLIGLAAVFMAAETAGAQPFAVGGAACALGRADDRGLHRVHWALLNLTEICLDTPAAPSAVKLSFVLVYAGKDVSTEPISILVRIQAHAWIGPELPDFTLDLDDHRLELMSPNRRYELVHPCPPGDSCSFNGVIVAVSAEELQLIATASSASGRGFGSHFTVPAEGLRAVRHLAALLGGNKGDAIIYPR